jgi:cytochrome c
MKSFIVSLTVSAGLLLTGSAAVADTHTETPMPAIIKKAGFHCDGCHNIDSKKVGPSWRDVSRFYNGKMEKTPTGKTLQAATGGQDVRAFLVEKVSLGGKGNWGKIAMSGNDPLPHDHPRREGRAGPKQAQIGEIVDWILNLEK